MAPRLSMTGIAKSLGGVPVLSDVGFRVEPGEIAALLGANGAGKSTLMKVLTGVCAKDGGAVEIDGAPTRIATPRLAAQAGIGFLPQEISVIPEMTVAENVCLGSMGREPLVRPREMRARAAAALADLGFSRIAPEARMNELGTAEQRVVEIARAIAARARLLVMDEPTAALSETDPGLIFEVLRRLRSQGTSVVYISHYLREVFAIADRIEVLRDGRNAGSFDPRASDVEAVLAAMLGRTAGRLFEARPARAPGPVAFEARGLSWRDRVRDVSLTLHAGEILGVFGLVGSGVERLGWVIVGAEAGATLSLIHI